MLAVLLLAGRSRATGQRRMAEPERVPGAGAPTDERRPAIVVRSRPHRACRSARGLPAADAARRRAVWGRAVRGTPPPGRPVGDRRPRHRAARGVAPWLTASS